jgi:hypothetical protein
MVEAEELVCLVLHRGQIFGCRLTIVERFGKNVKWRNLVYFVFSNLIEK